MDNDRERILTELTELKSKWEGILRLVGQSLLHLLLLNSHYYCYCCSPPLVRLQLITSRAQMASERGEREGELNKQTNNTQSAPWGESKV